MSTRTRFEKEAKGNSEMAYYRTHVSRRQLFYLPVSPRVVKKKKGERTRTSRSPIAPSSLEFFSSLVPPADSLKQATVLSENPIIILTTPRHVLGASLKLVRYAMLSF